MQPTLVAAGMPLILLGYQLVIDWVNLFPWNDIAPKTARERSLEAIFNYAPLLLIAYGFFVGTSLSVWLALAGAGLYFVGHLNAWWRPYFFGASAKERAEYDRFFGRTLKILPPIGDHPIPDAEHTVLGTIALVVVIAGIVAAISL